MLLNVVQKQARKNEQQAERIEQLTAQMTADKSSTKRTIAEQAASMHRQIAEQKVSMQRQIAELKASNEQEREKRTAIKDRLSKLEITIVAQHTDDQIDTAFNQ
jgi:cell division protein FtsB